MAQRWDGSQESLSESVMQWFVNGFAIWLFGSVIVALIYPASFAWVNLKSWLDPMLGVVMLGMGLTLTISDFTRLAKQPVPILLGVALQFTIMPTLGYWIARAFQLDTPIAVGLILVACCPGGTASNVISYIAKADVALSVTMTAFSTILAVFATPLLTAWLAGNRVDVDPWTLMLKTAMVVIVPVAVGLGLRRYWPSLASRLLPIAPSIAVLFIVLIVAGVVAGLQATILESGLMIGLAVLTVHGCGAALGFIVGRAVSRSDKIGRTIAIEVGMQNGGLGVSLANSGAFANPSLVALPCALGGLASCLIGSVLAAIWSRTGEASSNVDEEDSKVNASGAAPES